MLSHIILINRNCNKSAREVNYVTNAFHNCPQQQLIKFMLESGSKSLISKYIFPIKTQLAHAALHKNTN